MGHTYGVRTDEILDEEFRPHTVYGIDVWFENELVKSVRDVFFDYQKATRFVELINRENLSLIHLMDVIDDILS